MESASAAMARGYIGLYEQTLSAMLSYALDHSAWEETGAIFQALDAYWNTQGLSGKSAAWADLILAAATGPGQDPAESAEKVWVNVMGQQAVRQEKAGHRDQAARTYRLILAWLERQPETEWIRGKISVVHQRLGTTAEGRGRPEEAEDQYRESLTIKEELGDRAGTASTYHQFGIAAERRGQLDEAEHWYRKSLTIKEELGDRPGMSEAYRVLSITAHQRGQLDEAEDWSRRSLAISEELDDPTGMAYSYHQLGITAQARGRLDQAEDWSRRSLAITEKLGDSTAMAATYHQLGFNAFLRGRLDEAEDWYRKSLTINEQLGNRLGIADCYHQLGLTADQRGRPDVAEDWYRRSLAITEGLGVLALHTRAATYGQLGLLAEDRRQPRQALNWMIKSVTLFSEFPSPLTGRAPSHLAMLARQLGTPVLEEAWHEVTGEPVPLPVLDYITNHDDNEFQEQELRLSTSGSTALPPSYDPAKPTSLLDDLKDMGWFNS